MSSKLHFSIIVPVYNRALEVEELLTSLSHQTDQDFEVVIVEDGSDYPCADICKSFEDRLTIKYLTKPNSGPGQTRNYGSQNASGNYLIFFDSDCIIPPDYIKLVKARLSEDYHDAYGGPDSAHPDFTRLQKAINYSMTSVLTTGGIRGANENAGKFHPRSFNMGYSREVYDTTQGFSNMRFGEDIDMSLRILENNFSTILIKEAFVYHKRRSTLRQFFKQVFNSGLARINLNKRHSGSLKSVHTLPSLFVLGIIGLLIFGILISGKWFGFLLLFSLLVFVDALRLGNGVGVSLLAIVTTITQLFGYGLGFINGVWNRYVLGKEEYHLFEKTFYD